MKREKKPFASHAQITGHFLKKLGERYDPQKENKLDEHLKERTLY